MAAEAIIYIVDDDDSVRRAASRLFRTSGFKALTFESADEFLDYPVSDGPGCIVLDYQMPGRNGIEVQQELQRREIELPIVFLTGQGDIPTSVKAMKQGAVDFLPKPADDQTLIEAVEQAVEASTRNLERNHEVIEFKKRLASLTQREREVLNHVAHGLLNKQIASRLQITEATVKVHRGRMMEKVGVDSVAELVRLCERSAVLE